MRDLKRLVGHAILALTWGATVVVILWPFSVSVPDLRSLVDRLAFVGTGPPLDARDAVVNLLAFLPAGFVTTLLARRSPLQAAGWALSLSVALELIQIFAPARIVSPLDVVFNATGALIGASLPAAARFTVDAFLTAGIGPLPITVGGLGATMVAFAALQAGFGSPGGWSPDYPLIIGNEATGDRYWCGEVTDLVMSASGEEWNVESFSMVAQSVSVSNASCGEWLRSAMPVATVARAVNASHQFSMALRAAPGILTQAGPARIASISANPAAQNITVGQSGQDLVVRVRRRWAGRTGRRPSYRLRDVFQVVGEPVPIRLDVGTDSSIVTAGTQTLVDHHRVERQWWVVLLSAHEWRRSVLEVPAGFVFWLVMLSPVCLLAGAIAAHRPGRRGGASLTGAVCAFGAWAAVALAGVPLGAESPVVIPGAAAILAQTGLTVEIGRMRRRARPD